MIAYLSSGIAIDGALMLTIFDCVESVGDDSAIIVSDD